MTHLRLVADDLTGALDSAAQFAAPGRGIPVFLAERLPAALPSACAVDLGTREMDAAAAAALAARHARFLQPGAQVTAFRKLDSLLRGNGGIELAATLGALAVRRCVVAPAFPFHRRVTRGGRQWFHDGTDWRRAGEDLRATLESRGVRVRLARPGDLVEEGVSLWDAETDEDLRRIVETGARHRDSVLWCGSAGLAAALSGSGTTVEGGIERPVLGLFGSDHPVALAQLVACGGPVVRLGEGSAGGAAAASGHLSQAGVCLVAFDVPPCWGRREASELIAREIGRLTLGLPRPGSVVAVGGETLRSLCRSVGADRLEVVGQRMPGVPVSVIRGGAWDGVGIVSKSGAFGEDSLLRRLLGLGGESG